MVCSRFSTLLVKASFSVTDPGLEFGGGGGEGLRGGGGGSFFFSLPAGWDSAAGFCSFYDFFVSPNKRRSPLCIRHCF